VQEEVFRRLAIQSHLQRSDFNGNYKSLVLCCKTSTFVEHWISTFHL